MIKSVIFSHPYYFNSAITMEAILKLIQAEQEKHPNAKDLSFRLFPDGSGYIYSDNNPEKPFFALCWSSEKELMKTISAYT